MEIEEKILQRDLLQQQLKHLQEEKAKLTKWIGETSLAITELNHDIGNDLFQLREFETGETELVLSDGRVATAKRVTNTKLITDKSKLGADWLMPKTRLEPDTQKIKAALSKGELIEGAELEKPYYTVRVK